MFSHHSKKTALELSIFWSFANARGQMLDIYLSGEESLEAVGYRVFKPDAGGPSTKGFSTSYANECRGVSPLFTALTGMT